LAQGSFLSLRLFLAFRLSSHSGFPVVAFRSFRLSFRSVYPQAVTSDKINFKKGNFTEEFLRIAYILQEIA
jgi:hypothetical protein